MTHQSWLMPWKQNEPETWKTQMSYRFYHKPHIVLVLECQNTQNLGLKGLQGFAK